MNTTLHSQLSPYRTQLGYSLEGTASKLTQETDQAIVASSFRKYPTGTVSAARYVVENVMKTNAMVFPITSIMERISEIPVTRQ